MDAKWIFYAVMVAAGLVFHVVGRIAIPAYRLRTDQLGIRRAAALGGLGFTLVGVGGGILAEPDASGKVSYLVMFVILAGVGWLVFRKWWREPGDEEP